MKKVIVISLGGSLIIPDEINNKLLEEFKKIIIRNIKEYKFIIVCGGGKTARTYIKGLNNTSLYNREYLQCQIGIASTRLNARFLSYFFDKDAHWGIPKDMKQVKDLLRVNDLVFCGALRYGFKETSDSVAAKLARFFKAEFINLTNVKGLYDKDPKKFKDAKFILEISNKDFYKMAKKIKYKPGQHFVLDQNAAYTIKKYKIKAYILGPDMDNLDHLLNQRHFIGTVIY